MKQMKLIGSSLMLAIGVAFLILAACAKVDKDNVPITTKSKKAREHFVQGRDLFERLQAEESRQYLKKAVTEDPNFAMGYLFLSYAVPSAKEFFENLDKAVSLAEGVSEGERLWILGVQAGTYGMPIKQRELYQKLVELYPRDERALTLLGNNFFGQQDWPQAIELYNQSVAINPSFSQPYNQLGYAHRFLGNYPEAERAFQKYIELIPNDPNPYDSYAELLMKMGRFDESIVNYEKALQLNPNFVASHLGIATNLNLKGEHDRAREQLQKLFGLARNDGERRAALFGMAVSYVDEGQLEKALEQQDKQYALAEKIDDAAAMAGDLLNMGNILWEMGQPDLAMGKYQQALEVVEGSNLSEEVKDNNRRAYLYNTARVVLQKKDFNAAQAAAEEFKRQVEAIDNPLQIKLAHELLGEIALAQNSYDQALNELGQGNQQNPYNLYRLALAYQGKGDPVKAKEYFQRAANFNGLDNMNYAFIRAQARQMAAAL